MVYGIYEGNIERLEKKMQTIANKCAKYGCEFHYERVGEEIREMKLDDGSIVNLRFILVEAEGTAVMNGWKFVASVDRTENGNVINTAGGENVPDRYYDMDIVCEHCGVNRPRKYAFIVKNEETGEYKMVGKACLKDFTGGMSAEGVANYVSWFNEVIQGAEVTGCGRSDTYYDTKLFARYVAETIRCFGYVKRGAEYSTCDRAWDYMIVGEDIPCFWMSRKERGKIWHEMNGKGFNVENPKSCKFVEDAFKWVSEQDDSGNTYLHNVKIVCSMEKVASKHMGILASVFPTYCRELEYQAELREREEKAKKEKASEWQGEVGKRVEIDVADCGIVTSWNTDYGMTFIWKIIDDAGNVYVWKTGNSLYDWNDDVAKVIKGTVKAHNEYRGVKQTELTRVSVVRWADKIA